MKAEFGIVAALLVYFPLLSAAEKTFTTTVPGSSLVHVKVVADDGDIAWLTIDAVCDRSQKCVVGEIIVQRRGALKCDMYYEAEYFNRYRLPHFHPARGADGVAYRDCREPAPKLTFGTMVQDPEGCDFMFKPMDKGLATVLFKAATRLVGEAVANPLSLALAASGELTKNSALVSTAIH